MPADLDSLMAANGTPWCKRCEAYHAAASQCAAPIGVKIIPLPPPDEELLKLIAEHNRMQVERIEPPVYGVSSLQKAYKWWRIAEELKQAIIKQ